MRDPNLTSHRDFVVPNCLRVQMHASDDQCDYSLRVYNLILVFIGLFDYWKRKYKLLKNISLAAKIRTINEYQYAELNIDDEPSVYTLAMNCFQKFGFYPISFSSPSRFEDSIDQKIQAISQVIPYEKYSFKDSKDYYASYKNSFFGITQRKGGWDCFRHVEIIFAGAVPLYLGVKSIPDYTMIHYPKKFLGRVSDHYFRRNLLPSIQTIYNLVSYANENLTSLAMCRYFSDIAKIELGERDAILFVDSGLSEQPDYLSVFNFIGLKQMYEERVVSYFPEPDYVFQDFRSSTFDLYGRGFGYTKVLKRCSEPPPVGQRVKYVVFSNLERDWGQLKKFELMYSNCRFILFWGADKKIPNRIKEEVLRSGKGILFCREIY